VFIFIHVLYIHAQLNVVGSDNTNDPCDVIEYHFYINDDREHETLFMQHLFCLMYESLKKNDISLIKHWIWLDGCAGKFKLATQKGKN